MTKEDYDSKPEEKNDCDPSQKEKNEMFKVHLPYEIKMIVSSIEYFKMLTAKTERATTMSEPLINISNTPPINDIYNRNSCIEGVAMHTRELIDFFTQPRKWKNDAIVRDFLKKGEVWNPLIGKSNFPNLEKLPRLANEDILHLSYGRIHEDELPTDWDLIGIAKEIHHLMCCFLPKCKNEYVEELRKMLELLKTVIPTSAERDTNLN